MSHHIRHFKEFLQPILEPGTEILNISTYPIVPAGENYGGEILAVEVTEKTDKNKSKDVRHFVAKLTPSNEMLSVMFNIKQTFKREISIYMDVIPTLINLQKEYNIPESKHLHLFPKCYGARFNLHKTNNEITNDALMLFENLKTTHYVMEDRMVGFDLELSSYFLQNLAQFHALPIALKHLKPEQYENKVRCLSASSFGDSYTDEFKRYFIDGVTDAINKMEDGFEKYSQKIAQILDKGFKFEERFMKPDEKWGTLVHHDLWINNFLVRRNDDGKFVDLKVYDFQLACFGSFAHDLIFFLFTSVKQDVFDTFFESLLRVYYNSFVECLKEFEINTDVYTWQSFVDEIHRIGPRQISHIVIMMRPIYMRKNKLSNNSEMDEKELGAINDVDSRYHDKMRKNILAFVQHKWI